MAKVPFVTTYHGIYNAKSPLKAFYNSVMARGDAIIRAAGDDLGAMAAVNAGAAAVRTALGGQEGVTLANLSILKTGKARAIRFTTLDALCRELNCQPGDLLVQAPGPQDVGSDEDPDGNAPGTT